MCMRVHKCVSVHTLHQCSGVCVCVLVVVYSGRGEGGDWTDSDA